MRSLLAACLVVSLALANPGLQASLALADLNQVLMIAYAFGLTSAHFDLGDFSFDYDTSFGPLAANLSAIEVTDLSVDYVNSVFSFQSPDVLTYSIYDFSLQASAGYSIAFDDIPLAPGNATITLSGTNLTASVSLSAVNGKPQLKLNSYTFALGPITAKTTLPPAFDTVIDQIIAAEEPLINSMIPTMLAKYLPLVNTVLAGLDMNIAIPGTDVAVDLSLTSNPTILNDDLLVIGLSGAVTQGGKPVNGGNSVSIPPQGVLSEGIQIGVTDALVNSLLIPLWPLFNYNLDSIPQWLGEDLTTDDFEDILPGLGETFGKGLPVMINVRANGPITYGTNGNVNIEAHVLADIKVKTGLFHWTLGATFALKARIELSLSVQNNVAHAHIVKFSLPSISVVHNFIGTIIVEMLRPAIAIVEDIVIHKVNDQIKDLPIPLPMGIGSFIQTDDVVVKTGYILAGLEL